MVEADAGEGRVAAVRDLESLGELDRSRGRVGRETLGRVGHATDAGFGVAVDPSRGTGETDHGDDRPAADFGDRGAQDEFSREALAFGRTARRGAVSARGLDRVEVLRAGGDREAAEEDLAAAHEVRRHALARVTDVRTIGTIGFAVLHADAEAEDEARAHFPFEADRTCAGAGVEGRGQHARVFGDVPDAAVEPPAEAALDAVGLRETAGAELGSLFGHLPVEVGGDLRGGEAHAAREAALQDGAEARAHDLGGLEGLGGHHRRTVGGRDDEARVDVAREGHAVDQDAVRVVGDFHAGGGVRGGAAQHRHARS